MGEATAVAGRVAEVRVAEESEVRMVAERAAGQAVTVVMVVARAAARAAVTAKVVAMEVVARVVAGAVVRRVVATAVVRGGGSPVGETRGGALEVDKTVGVMEVAAEVALRGREVAELVAMTAAAMGEAVEADTTATEKLADGAGGARVANLAIPSPRGYMPRPSRRRTHKRRSATSLCFRRATGSRTRLRCAHRTKSSSMCAQCRSVWVAAM